VAASGVAPWSLATLLLTLFLRYAVTLVVGWFVLRDRQVMKYPWLIPLRDLLAVLVWIASLGGHTVIWRGDRFRLKDGKLTRIAS
jgi:ceramide glucosyltransferase